MRRIAMTNFNPWENMAVSTSRRIDSFLKYDFFWITDQKGRYGIYLKTAILEYDQLIIDANLKGIEIVKRPATDNLSEVFFVLTNQEDWQLFYSLCSDILNISGTCSNEFALLIAINHRLKRWQRFLSQNSSFSLSLIQQMGLFTELHCLKDVILPVFGIEEAISSWVGPDFDKQDFSLSRLLIEVKSYISSKGPIIKISSIHQLDNSIKQLILLTCGITRTTKGLSIKDLVLDLRELIVDNEDRDVFENKLAEYGYIENVTEEPFYQFSIDRLSTYLITDDFPRILSSNIGPQITSVNYTIDLSKCKSFEVDPLSIFIEK